MSNIRQSYAATIAQLLERAGPEATMKEVRQLIRAGAPRKVRSNEWRIYTEVGRKALKDFQQRRLQRRQTKQTGLFDGPPKTSS